MTTLFQCPECAKTLSRGENRCTCGWFAITETKHKPDYRCHYQKCGIRCKEIGTVSASVRGDSWVCRNHLFK